GGLPAGFRTGGHAGRAGRARSRYLSRGSRERVRDRARGNGGRGDVRSPSWAPGRGSDRALGRPRREQDPSARRGVDVRVDDFAAGLGLRDHRALSRDGHAQPPRRRSRPGGVAARSRRECGAAGADAAPLARSQMSGEDTGLDLVTGAFSYSGADIAGRLLASGRRVRTLTFHPDRPHPLRDRVEVQRYRFDDPVALARSLEGVTNLYNTYWVRFDHGRATFSAAIANS